MSEGVETIKCEFNEWKSTEQYSEVICDRKHCTFSPTLQLFRQFKLSIYQYKSVFKFL